MIRTSRFSSGVPLLPRNSVESVQIAEEECLPNVSGRFVTRISCMLQVEGSVRREYKTRVVAYRGCLPMRSVRGASDENARPGPSRLPVSDDLDVVVSSRFRLSHELHK